MKSVTVEAYILSSGKWEHSLGLLRELLCSTELDESIKWGMPVYTLKNKNVAGISAFKSHVGIWFFQGVFLSDPEKKLINAQEGVTKALRQWRFGSFDEIEKEKDTILIYLQEAIKNQEEGKDMKPDRNKPVDIPPELEKAFKEDPALKLSFDSLTLSKRREFAEYINQAKRTETRERRVEKILPMIRVGTGLNDRYKS